MSSDWPNLPLADVLELVIDHRGKTPKKLGFKDFHTAGYPVLSAKHVKTSGLINIDSIRYANSEMYQKWMKEPLKEGDIVLTSEAPLGETYFIDGLTNYVLGQRVFGLRPRKEIIEPRYLLAWLTSKVGQSRLKERASGSTVQGIKQSELLKIEIDVPPLNVQRAIASNEFCFSTKIALNKRTNQTLEQMAQAIFKSWFVDFEPVKAKIAALEAGGSEEDALLAAMQAISGKDAAQLAQLKAEHADQYTELRTTAELFPSAMQDSDLGEVPKGWFWSTIGRDFDVIMGQSPPGDTYNESGEGMAFFQGRRDFGARFPTNRVFCTKPKRIAQKDDTLLSVRAPVGDVNIASQECCIGRGLAALRHISKCPTYTYYSISNLSSEFLSFDSEGTVFGSINQKNLKEINVISPPKQIINQFSRKLRSIDTLISINNDETLNLSKIRDTLLPRLLTGEIPLSESSQLEESIK